MSEEEAVAQVCHIIEVSKLDICLTVVQPQITALLFAGSVTTVNLTSEILYELALHPTVQHRLREELAAVMSTGSGSQLTYDQLAGVEHTPYLDAVLREGSRLKGVLMDISRYVRLFTSGHISHADYDIGIIG
jgi:cytochrome P450